MEDTILERLRVEKSQPFFYEDDLCVVIRTSIHRPRVDYSKPIPMLSGGEDQALLGHLLVVAGLSCRKQESLMPSAWSLITVQVVAKRYSATYISSLAETERGACGFGLAKHLPLHFEIHA